jgi:hypothetical protein
MSRKRNRCDGKNSYQRSTEMVVIADLELKIKLTKLRAQGKRAQRIKSRKWIRQETGSSTDKNKASLEI